MCNYMHYCVQKPHCCYRSHAYSCCGCVNLSATSSEVLWVFIILSKPERENAEMWRVCVCVWGGAE